MSHTLVGNKIVDHSGVVGASPVGAVPTTSSFLINTWLQRIEQRQLKDETRNMYVLGTYIKGLTVCISSIWWKNTTVIVDFLLN